MRMNWARRVLLCSSIAFGDRASCGSGSFQASFRMASGVCLLGDSAVVLSSVLWCTECCICLPCKTVRHLVLCRRQL
ncbi:hypothetical protein F4823DRAFT_589418 [Ustulina deusta]|nr:hypothetical protein F4823DRAFT_589418 [Ustulina deusta]